MINFLLKYRTKFYTNNYFNRKYNGNYLAHQFYYQSSQFLDVLFIFYIRHIAKRFHGKLDRVNENIIVSLTSFPARIDNLWITIESLLAQSVQPSKIVLNLCKDEFDKAKTSVPLNLTYYEKYGLEINWVKENLRPHNKYFYTLAKYPEKCVVTVDDDIYYRPDMIEHLLLIYKKFPNCVCTNMARCILDSNGKDRQYRTWNHVIQDGISASHNYIALGYNGVLYPPSVLNNARIYNTEMIKQTCLRADDLWLKANEILDDIKVATGSFYINSVVITGSQRISLMSSNVDDEEVNGNDTQWGLLDKKLDIKALLRRKVEEERTKRAN